MFCMNFWGHGAKLYKTTNQDQSMHIYTSIVGAMATALARFPPSHLAGLAIDTGV